MFYCNQCEKEVVEKWFDEDDNVFRCCECDNLVEYKDKQY